MASIGITGSIGSGKTTFRNLLAARVDADVFDADLVAGDLLENDQNVRRRVADEISSSAYGSDGKADRALIRQVVFGDPDAKSRLEKILHPLVRERWVARAADPACLTRHFLVDIPLLFETAAQDHFRWIITVACSDDIQRKRLAARGLSPEMVDAIIDAQLPPAQKIARSTHVVWNDGCIEALSDQANFFAEWLANAR